VVAGVACALLAAAPSLFAQSSIKLSEVMASNLTFIQGGAITDWVELVNQSSVDVDLTGVSFSDDEFNPTKWSFPPGTSIPGNGFLLVAFDPDRAASDLATEFLNTGFGIKAEGRMPEAQKSSGRIAPAPRAPTKRSISSAMLARMRRL
jgi:hypothetical protein